MQNTTRRLGVGLAVFTSLVLIWINGAVGIIGDDNPANLLYGGVLLMGLIGASLSHLKPPGMALTLFAMAVAQLLVPVIAIIILPPSVISWAPGVVQVFGLNAVFALFFAGSGLLFRQAARTST